MKKILAVIVLGLLLSGCTGSLQSYDSFKKEYSSAEYIAMACSEKMIPTADRNCGMAARSDSQAMTNKAAAKNCATMYGDCVVVTEGDTYVYETNIQKANEIDFVQIIGNAKKTCKTLGFEEGTDKFKDCALKLYSQEVDNIVALKVAKQKSSSSSSSGTMTIYDPVRDRQNQIDRGMKMLSGGCTLGIDC